MDATDATEGMDVGMGSRDVTDRMGRTVRRSARVVSSERAALQREWAAILNMRPDIPASVRNDLDDLLYGKASMRGSREASVEWDEREEWERSLWRLTLDSKTCKFVSTPKSSRSLIAAPPVFFNEFDQPRTEIDEIAQIGSVEELLAHPYVIAGLAYAGIFDRYASFDEKHFNHFRYFFSDKSDIGRDSVYIDAPSSLARIVILGDKHDLAHLRSLKVGEDGFFRISETYELSYFARFVRSLIHRLEHNATVET